MNWRSSILALALAAGLGACAPSDGDPLAEAQTAFAAQNYIAARELAMAALAEDANDVAALELLARTQLAMGQGGDVASTLERLQRAGGSAADGALLAAEGFLQSGEIDLALDLLGDVNSAEGWRLRALAAAMQDDDAGALAAFRQGRTAAGDRGKLYAAEASFHLEHGDPDAAAEAVALARNIAPDRIETLFVSARLAEARGHHRQALRDYLQIVDKAPLDRPALLGAIAASERVGERDATRQLIAYGARTHPFDREFVYQQARLDAWEGDWEAVRQRLQAQEAELVDHAPARLLYAEALLQIGQVETARAIAGPIIARNPDDPEASRIGAAIAAAS